MVQLVFFFVCVAVTARCADQPPLFQLKQLAESGNPQAEFDYGTRIANSNPAECFTMVLRAAESGYGPAENWVGSYFTQKLTYTFDKTQQKQYRWRAILFTARAAYKNIPQAQSRLAGFYLTGNMLPKDPALAYGWAAIAAKVSSATESPVETVQYRLQLDRLIANTSTQTINAGQQFADSFRVQLSGMTRVEADLIASELRLTGFIAGNPILNGVPMKSGVARKLTIEGEPIEMVCLGLKSDSAQFQFVGSDFYVILPLGRAPGDTPIVKSW
jgi:hypothetical protein